MDFEMELLRATMVALPDPVFVITESGEYLEIIGGRDPGFYHDGSGLKGKSIFEVLPREKANWFLEQIRITLRQDRLRTVRYSLAGCEVKGLDEKPGPAGDIHFEGRIQPLPLTLGNERAVVWVARNITSQYAIERKLQRLSETDSLTGIFNRRKFLKVLDRHFQEFKRYKRITSLVILDIDHFKDINDAFGHHIGDDMLCRLAGNCVSEIRNMDTLCRIGGDEFALVLPQTGSDDACYIAERLRGISEQLEVKPGSDCNKKVTISVGVSEFIAADKSYEQLIKRADTALYEAKEKGRNCVISRDLQAA